MKTAEEIKGKAYVHWKSWHEAYPGLVDQEYLDALTLEKCGFVPTGEALVSPNIGAAEIRMILKCES